MRERGWVDSLVGKVLVCHISMSFFPARQREPVVPAWEGKDRGISGTRLPTRLAELSGFSERPCLKNK